MTDSFGLRESRKKFVEAKKDPHSVHKDKLVVVHRGPHAYIGVYRGIREKHHDIVLQPCLDTHMPPGFYERQEQDKEKHIPVWINRPAHIIATDADVFPADKEYAERIVREGQKRILRNPEPPNREPIF